MPPFPRLVESSQPILGRGEQVSTGSSGDRVKRNSEYEVIAMTKRYIVTIKGEFEETQAVVAENEDEAQEKARKMLGEIINRKPTSELVILGIKALVSGKPEGRGR